MKMQLILFVTDVYRPQNRQWIFPVMASRILSLAFLFLLPAACNGQPATNNSGRAVAAGFENREYTYYDIRKDTGPADTSAGWAQDGQKILLTGTVYQPDGATPARDILLYYYHTNTGGRYLHKPAEERSMPPNELGQTHGYIRGWVKTDTAGRYFIYTVRPGTYPSKDEPAHVHITVKEPDKNEYYIDDFVFDDDILLSSGQRKKMENRGGSGVLRMVKKEGLHIGERNIILGLNIPGHPVKRSAEISSGRNIGEDVLSFIPYHAWGPDRGTKTCPVCKYGWYHGILYFVGNNPNWMEIKQWLVFLEAESKRREKYLKVYFIYGNEEKYSKKAREAELEKIGEELDLEKVALTFVPSFSDSDSEIDLNKINPAAANTFIIYKRSRIVDKFINLRPGDNNFNLIARRLDQTINEYFDLAAPKNQ